MPKRRKKTKSMGKICHKKTIIDGITFDSKTEAEYYLYITKNKKKLNIKEIKLQPKFLLQEKYIIRDNDIYIYNKDNDKAFKKMQKEYPGKTIQSIEYIADFKITYTDDHVDVIDIKGIKTTDFKLKEKMFNFKYPEYGGLKCVALYKGEWMLWDEYKKRQKEDKKSNNAGEK